MAEPEEQEESIGVLVGRLVEDGKTYARAEIGYYRTLVTGKLGEAVKPAIFGGAALVIALSAVTALLVGLILTLATLVGAAFATLIVIVAALSFAGLLGWLAYRQIQRMFGSTK